MSDLLARGTPQGRRVLATVTLGSGIALLDGSTLVLAGLASSSLQAGWILAA